MMVKARYVVPVDAPVIENGAVTFERGRITAVGLARTLNSPPVTDYGDAVICPGFVNAHTHLELSMLAGRVPPCGDFVDWLRRLVRALSAEPTTRERIHEAVRKGVTESLRWGVTTVGDITRRPQWTREVLAASPLRGVSFGEVISIGTRRHMLADRLDAAVYAGWPTCSVPRPSGWPTFSKVGSRFGIADRAPTSKDVGHPDERIRAGISPHAPYTVEPDAMRACAERARASNLRLCIHLAESADEELFTRSCEGPFAEHLRELGVWDDAIPAGGCGPVELALRTGLLGKQTVIAHANYVSDADVKRIAASGAAVAYCPRTHGAFEHPPHRFRDMSAAGVNVCVGTDSLASNPSLSILDELRFLRRCRPDLPAEQVMAMGPLRGAYALGFEQETGSLTVGKSADLVVIPLERAGARLESRTSTDSAAGWASIFESTQPPQAVYASGELQQ